MFFRFRCFFQKSTRPVIYETHFHSLIPREKIKNLIKLGSQITEDSRFERPVSHVNTKGLKSCGVYLGHGDTETVGLKETIVICSRQRNFFNSITYENERVLLCLKSSKQRKAAFVRVRESLYVSKYLTFFYSLDLLYICFFPVFLT